MTTTLLDRAKAPLTVREAMLGARHGDATTSPVPRSLPAYDLAHLDHPTLKRLTVEYGVDGASTVLFDALLSDPENATFLRALEDAGSRDGARPAFPEGTRLVVVPGGFYKERPDMGSGGEAFLELAKEWALPAEQVPLASLGGVAANTRRVRDFFAARSPGRDVVVTISKGGYEFSRAIAASPHHFTTVRAWINVAGLLRGSLVANHILSSPWRRFLLSTYLRLKGGDRKALTELVWQGAATRRPPPGVKVISCVGVPLTSHTRGTIQRRHAAVAAEGPNDGASLVLDTLVRPGHVLPLWGADHYFRTFSRVERLVRAILAFVAAEGWLADDAPAAATAVRGASRPRAAPLSSSCSSSSQLFH
jgi:hypothetical protein